MGRAVWLRLLPSKSGFMVARDLSAGLPARPRGRYAKNPAPRKTAQLTLCILRAIKGEIMTTSTPTPSATQAMLPNTEP
jgi:hypothetical protein